MTDLHKPSLVVPRSLLSTKGKQTDWTSAEHPASRERHVGIGLQGPRQILRSDRPATGSAAKVSFGDPGLGPPVESLE